MPKEKIVLSSQIVDIADSEDPRYLELTNRVCFYNEPNGNGVKLDFDDDALEKAKTLIHQPVVAKYTTNSMGQPTFKGHECYVDENGEVEFGTEEIGTHTDVYIQEDDVLVNGTTEHLPCLFAKYRIWKRNKNVVNAVRRLFGLNKLFSSWEILPLSYEYADGIKTLKDYLFESNCLLGYEYAQPAYGPSAVALSLSALENPQLEIAEALSQDLLEIEDIKDGDNNVRKKTVVDNVSELTSEIEHKIDETVIETETSSTHNDPDTEEATVNQNDDESNVEVSEDVVASLTLGDLYEKVRKACRDKLDCWCYISFLFPEEHIAWVKSDREECELDLLKFEYTVNEDVVTVSDPEKVTLTVSPQAINTTIASLQDEISLKNDALVEANSKINDLLQENASLLSYKDQVEAIEREKQEAEISSKKEALKNLAINSGLISSDEIESSQEIASYIENLDEASIKTMIADRYMESATSKKENKKQKITVSEQTTEIKLNLNNDDSNDLDAIHKVFRSIR